MKKIIIMFIAGAFALTSFESCKKDDDSSGGSATIVGDWIQTGATQDGKDTWDSDWEDCEKDDITTFTSDGKYSVDEGATKCDPNDPQISESGTYTMSSDNKTLTLESFAFEVVTLSSTQLTIKLEILNTVATSTFKRK